MNKHYFTKNVEKMIDPIDVGTIHFMQDYIKFLPANIQNKMINNGAKKNPYMGFVVEPYSFFLCYELIDLEYAKKLIPDNYKLIKTKIFEIDEPKYYCVFGSFNVHTSAFWGTRMEFYIIAENIDTGLLSWVIIDYDTNTISFDVKNGLVASTTSECILTTNYDGDVIVDIKGIKNNHQLVVETNINNGHQLALDSRLWLEGNLSITYGRDISDNKGEAFAVAFNPKEVEKALKIPYEDVNIQANTWYPGLFESKPTNVVCFPFAQHFVSDSPGHFSSIKNEQELVNHLNNLNFEKMANYSSKPIKKSFQMGQLISTLLIIILIILLIIK